MQSMAYAAVLFDLDGVLLNTMPYHLEAFNECFRSFGIEVSEQTIAGKSTVDVFRSLLPSAISRDEIAELSTRKSSISRKLIFENSSNVLDPRTNALLRKVGSRYPMAICTSGKQESIQAAKEIGLETSLFSVILTQSDVEKSKPDPEIFVKGASRLTKPPESCLVVEDSISGVTAALAAGCTVAVMRGTGGLRLPSEEKTFYISQLWDLWPILDNNLTI
jgi:HAD superfamily hydrolase (TIGR01509 family)